jgi:hypothetical protein
MRVLVFFPTGLGRLVESDSDEQLRQELFEVARELRDAIDY